MQRLKIVFTILIIFILHGMIQGQSVSIPYRVGDKFGLADEKGKMIIQPDFDLIEPGYNSNQWFTAYTFKDGVALSSLIYKNRIIISNKKYKDYVS